MSYRSSAPDLNNNGWSDFLMGGKQKPRRPSNTMPRCAFGESCRKTVHFKHMGDMLMPTTMPKHSNFCVDHTCIGMEGEPPCFNKVIKSGVNRCAVHFQCTVPGCSGQRVLSTNGGWWDCCAHHQCDADGCYAPREYNSPKRRHFNYCPEHKCVKDSCEQSHPAWKPYCTTHTCVKTDCNDIVDGDEKLCVRHIKCAHKTCPSNRVRKDGEYQPFCSRHSACTVSQCARDKKPGLEFCSLHTCHMSDCTKCCIGDNFYCSDHICDPATCRNPRTFYLESNNVVLTRYCPIHECRKPSCHLSARNQTYGYCKAHNCEIPSCNNLKMIDDSNPPLTKCRKHYDEDHLDTSSPPRPPPTAPSPAPNPNAITLTTLSSQLSRLQRTADDIKARSYYDAGAGLGGGGGAQARVAEEAAEASRRLEEVQRGVLQSLRQQGAKVNAIWDELRGRGFGGQI